MTNLQDFIVIKCPAKDIQVVIVGEPAATYSLREEWLAVAVYKTGERSIIGGFSSKNQAIREVAEQKAHLLAMETA